MDDTCSKIFIPIQLEKEIPRVRSKPDKNPAKETAKHRSIRELLNAYHTLGFLKECREDTRYCSPLNFINGHLTVNFDRLNDATSDLPIILDDPAEIFDQITESSYFSLFTLTEGICQFKLKKNCMEYTTFEVGKFFD